MTNLLSTFRQGMHDGRMRQADRLDAKRTQKALRLNPQAELLVTQVSTSMEMEELVSRGWHVVATTNLTPAGGTSLFTRFTLAKANPNLPPTR